MVGHDRAPAFIDDRRMRNAFGVADIHDVPNDIVGIFLERIIRRAIEVASRTVIVDPETSTDIEITQLMSELAKLRVVAGRFPDRTVVTYDPRGVERSPRADGVTGATPDEHAEDLHRLTEELARTTAGCPRTRSLLALWGRLATVPA